MNSNGKAPFGAAEGGKRRRTALSISRDRLRILAVVRGRPGITYGELYKACGGDKIAFYNDVTSLARRGKLSHTNGRPRIYFTGEAK